MKLSVPQNNEYAVSRLTALWALNESGLGGILHAAKFPFTGIFVGGFAVIIITLIAHYSNFSFKAILKATGVVLMIKAAVSPHSPFPAYLAVSFQGLFGAVIFSLTKNINYSSVIFGGIALLESAIQKILLTVLFFGMSFWKALDGFVLDTLRVFNLSSDFSFSKWVAYCYVIAYFIIGIIIGNFIRKIPNQILSLDFSCLLIDKNEMVKSKYGNKRKIGIYSLLVISILISLFLPFKVLSSFVIWELVLRLVFFMLLFYYVIGPLTTKIVLMFSKGRMEELSQVNKDIAELRMVIKPLVYYIAKNYKGLSRLRMFVLYMLAITLKDIREYNG
ncbi:MAG: hypothetical protein ACKOX3_02260 [Bacteroidota bacterium]